MDKYNVGDVWLYQHREGEDNSTVIINKIEVVHEQLPIYHITIRDVNIVNSQSETGFTHKLSHAPVSLETLEKSLTERVGQIQPDSDYLEGYNVWHDAYVQGEAGIFTITVAEIVTFIEQAINPQQ